MLVEKFLSGVLLESLRGGGGVAGNGRLAGQQTFYFWGRCTMELVIMHSDWMPVAACGLAISFIC